MVEIQAFCLYLSFSPFLDVSKYATHALAAGLAIRVHADHGLATMLVAHMLAVCPLATHTLTVHALTACTLSTL